MMFHTSSKLTSRQPPESTSAIRAFPVKLIEDEGKRCAAYRLLFARRFPKRALSSRRRAVRERVTNRLAPIATLALPSHKGSSVQRWGIIMRLSMVTRSGLRKWIARGETALRAPTRKPGRGTR